VSPLLVDLDNTLIDRAGAFARWAREFTSARGGSAADAAWLVAADRDGLEPRERLAAMTGCPLGQVRVAFVSDPGRCYPGNGERAEEPPAVRSCQEGRTGWIWITPALIEVYREVRRLGFVSTVGTYRDGRLVGGLWGIGIGRVFGVMSMFHREDQAGSLAVAALVDAVLSEDRWSVIDFGVLTPNFQMYGAREISAGHFRELVWSNLKC
jgi:hypothetical protein